MCLWRPPGDVDSGEPAGGEGDDDEEYDRQEQRHPRHGYVAHPQQEDDNWDEGNLMLGDPSLNNLSVWMCYDAEDDDSNGDKMNHELWNFGMEEREGFYFLKFSTRRPLQLTIGCPSMFLGTDFDALASRRDEGQKDFQIRNASKTFYAWDKNSYEDREKANFKGAAYYEREAIEEIATYKVPESNFAIVTLAPWAGCTDENVPYYLSLKMGVADVS